jgi:hypothetical protein
VTSIGPVDHILRAALPWRTAAELTECGKPQSDLANRVVTRAEAADRIRRLGKERASFGLCMTCWSAADRHQPEGRGADAVAVVARALTAVQFAAGPFYGREVSPQWRERQRLNVEFEGMVALVNAHRDEYDAYLAGRSETVSLDERRRRRRRPRAGG